MNQHDHSKLPASALTTAGMKLHHVNQQQSQANYQPNEPLQSTLAWKNPNNDFTLYDEHP
jgi:hypothetical protein